MTWTVRYLCGGPPETYEHLFAMIRALDGNYAKIQSDTTPFGRTYDVTVTFSDHVTPAQVEQLLHVQ